ncbi:MAG: DedA family protein [Gammaproteobacteria bacterium]|nr:DedA family protein [Gammaproteobacteria bacterium]
MIDSQLSLFGLFFSALFSASILPGGSEAVLAALMTRAAHDPLTLWVVATLGNALGGLSTWYLGVWMRRRWPGREVKHKYMSAVARVRVYGAPALLFSWLPVVGDALCLAAGWLGTKKMPTIAFIVVGKGLRYAVIVVAMAMTVR